MSQFSPVLSAIMCDGMGWFTSIDYKRMLLVYDEIYYLLPKTPVEFNDVDGQRRFMYFPLASGGSSLFKVYHHEPDEAFRSLISTAAVQDAKSAGFASIVETIPQYDRLYTWRVVNADGDLGGGQSLGLLPEQASLAHAVLLNKFLLAADHLNCIPITGKPYIHGLISEKYRLGVNSLREAYPDLLLPSLKTKQVRFNPVASQILSAIVPDSELEKRSEEEILEYKTRHRDLFERFSYTMRQLVAKVSALPLSADFEAELEDLVNTEIWRERQAVEQELRSAWESFFKSTIKAAAGGLLAVGVAPFLSLGAITVGSALAATTAIAPWALSELVDFLDRRKHAQEHGLYYLMKFTE